MTFECLLRRDVISFFKNLDFEENVKLKIRRTIFYNKRRDLHKLKVNRECILIDLPSQLSL